MGDNTGIGRRGFLKWVALSFLFVVPSTVFSQEGVPEAGGETAGQYVLNEGKSSAHALVYKAGAASSMAHDHVIEATRMEGALLLNPSDGSIVSFQVQVPVFGLVPDPDALRAKVGLPDTLSETQCAEVKRHMLAADQLSGDKYKFMEFVSQAVTSSADSAQIEGTLTVRGQKVSVAFPAKLTRSDGAVRIRGEVSVRQTGFGYEPYSALMGTLKVKDEVDIVVDLAFEK